MLSPIRLIAGLGNPGEKYTSTRHNAGAWFVEKLAQHYQLSLKSENKFKSFYGNFLFNNERVHLIIPTTYMNHSGQAIKLISDFYKLPPENILIAHDELDIPIGESRLKFAGGHGGHNGLRDIMGHLHTPNFYRLRIGIDHPREKNNVIDYVLNSPSRHEKKLIDQSLDNALAVIDCLLNGQNEKAMQLLHTKP